MSLIPCTEACVYQLDGCCHLSRAASCASPGCAVGCVNFVPRSKHSAKSLSDVIHSNQFQPFRDC
jgi:hypothetical protein